jgi:hypothetical protein
MFNGYPGIVRSINEAWNKAKDYYSKTDQSITWIALTIMNPRFKMKYFKDKWTSNESHALHIVKLKVKKLWDKVYKGKNVIIRPLSPPSIALLIDYLRDLLDQVAP